uniref:HECT-type E3 ubiquitin transferase n=1 Tax=Dermatophagoides pteronyssinus TaxID=6956 RepID=A0A6P6YA30_DERPT|nr:E3 ubiquitin-protein ligase HUWE1-like [Dermatophagoides pteronyssinus]
MTALSLALTRTTLLTNSLKQTRTSTMNISTKELNHSILINLMIRQQPILLLSSFNLLLFVATSLISFDNKRSYFRLRIIQLKNWSAKDQITLIVNRENILHDTFTQLLEHKNYISNFSIIFEGEEGVDEGGLTREFYRLLSKEIFNPDYCMFVKVSDKGTDYHINPLSRIDPDHLECFRLIGLITAKCLFDGYYLDAHFTRPLYKIIVGKTLTPSDSQFIDEQYYTNLQQLLDNSIENLGLELYFNIDIVEFDQIKTTELIPNGNNIPVTDDNKLEYVNLLCEFKCLRGIKEQVTAFMKGFNSLIPRFLISIFDEMEIELLICGLPDISIDDLQAHTIYSNYVKEDKTIIHFWEVLREFDTNQVASFLQFVTGSGKVPLGGFKNLMGNNGIQYFTITKVDNVNRLPTAHTCFNQLELPSYESKEILKTKLLQAIMEGRDGFGFT